MRLRSLICIVVVLLMAGILPAAGQDQGRYQGSGDPGGFLNIVPPGQDGVLNALETVQAEAGQYPAHFMDQLGMYGKLIYSKATPGMTEAKLLDYFKDASFGVKSDDIERVYSPGGRTDVVVIRDKSFGVPHIYGTTREGTMFAQGYTGAEDRLFLMDALRHVGRADLSSFLGPAPGNLAMDRDQMAAGPYTEEDLTKQVAAIARMGKVGAQVISDGMAYVDGVNKYITEALLDPTKLPTEYPALQVVPEKWKPEDIVASAALVGAIFGKGGGREVANYCALKRLSTSLGGAAKARQVFDDFKFADDAEAPMTTTKPFAYESNLGPVKQAAIPDLDCGSLQAIAAPAPGAEQLLGMVVDLVPTPPLPVAGGIDASSARTGVINAPWGDIPIEFNLGMSNAVLISGENTTTGRPLAVFGPQTSYYSPQLLVEKDVHGPGIDARGVAFAGTDIYVELGRGRNYAFSATSAGADNVDQFVLKLCDPAGGKATTSSMGYVRNGSCKRIEAVHEVKLAKPSAGGMPSSPEDFQKIIVNKYFERAPDYGPLTARGKLKDGTPIAVAVERTTYQNELGSARGFSQLNDPQFMSDGYESFRKAIGLGVDYTFNWFYVDGKDIGYQASCACPKRALGVDPYLPAWGTGAWDWKGMVGLETLPAESNPSKGYLISWNNKQAPGSWSSDSQFGWGPIHRSSLLERRTVAALGRGKLTRSQVVDIMAVAGTTDLRAQEIVPLLVKVMGTSAPSGADSRAQDMFARLRAWALDDLGHRRDHDHNGVYEHAQAIAIMDAWWEPLVDAVFKASSADARNVIGVHLHDAPQNHIGSAFQDSMYAHVQKDLRQVLGEKVSDPLSRTYCGAGKIAACRAALWASLTKAAGLLSTEFGSAKVNDWKRVVADDQVQHTALGVVGVPAIAWVNRPTFQQVVQIPGTVTRVAGAKAVETQVLGARRSLPATGVGSAQVLGVVLASLGCMLMVLLRRRKPSSVA